MRLELENEKIIHATNCSISITMETRETSSKDITGNWTDAEAAKLSYTISAEGLYSQDDTIDAAARADIKQLADYIIARTAIAWKMTTDVTGDEEMSGTALVTSVDFDFPDAENGTWSISLQGKGAITQAQTA